MRDIFHCQGGWFKLPGVCVWLQEHQMAPDSSEGPKCRRMCYTFVESCIYVYIYMYVNADVIFDLWMCIP